MPKKTLDCHFNNHEYYSNNETSRNRLFSMLGHTNSFDYTLQFYEANDADEEDNL